MQSSCSPLPLVPCPRPPEQLQLPPGVGFTLAEPCSHPLPISSALLAGSPQAKHGASPGSNWDAGNGFAEQETFLIN